MQKLTQLRFERLTPSEKTEAYFSHEANQYKNKRGQDGPSLLAQYYYCNNWQSAFRNFKDSLPLY